MNWPSKKTPGHPRRLLSRRSVLAAAALVLVAGLAVAAALHAHKVTDLLGPRVASAATTPAVPATQPPRTKLVALPQAHIANGTKPLVVTLSAPPSPTTPVPMLAPADAGTWKVESDSFVFRPSSTLAPCAHYTLTVWARTAATGYRPLGLKRKESLGVACPPTAALQQALARLGFLGAVFRPAYIFHEPAGALTRQEATMHAYRPPRGMLASLPAGAPRAHLGDFEAITRGALTVYQEDRGLQASGEPNTTTWESLLYDLTHYRRDPKPYTWVTVSESPPETLHVHVGRRIAYTTLANTGVPGAETQTGVFPIYARYVSTTMSGEDVDGEKYVVPDVPWVNYFNGGDAVHGYPRASYGFPQSNGCVELPIENARVVFGMLQLGDIVWVS